MPAAVLKTRRSMRAVHFHPQGLPIVLTAEVQDPSPTPELPATLTESGPYMQEEVEEEAAAGAAPMEAEPAAAAAAASAEAMTPPGSGEVPIPSPQLLGGVAATTLPRAHPSAAGVYVATAAGPVPVGQFAASAAAAIQPNQPLRIPDLPAAALALSGPLHHLHLRSGAASPPPQQADAAAAAGPRGAGGDRQQQGAAAATSGRPGAPGWVPPGSGQLPPSMVPTGWELPFPSNLFAGGQPTAAGPGQAGSDGGGGWAATAASLPQVMAAFSAAAWNIIGEEQPPRVRLRIWRCGPVLSRGACVTEGCSRPPYLRAVCEAVPMRS